MDELGLGIKIDEEAWINRRGEKKKLRTINSKRRRRT